jgi:hypothetical protein
MIRPLIGPSTTVRVCQSIPLDNTYTDTILFTSKSAQESYFASKTKKVYSGLTYQRLASNSSTWAIFLEDVADYFYDCNYLCFQNGGFGNKWLYAFISDILYINENCTAITFEIDVMQTWLFDFEIKKSFIERMHVADDTISRNVVEEDLNFMQRYEYYYVENSRLFEGSTRPLDTDGEFDDHIIYDSIILVATSEDVDEEDEVLEGGLIQNTYQGLKYIGFNANDLGVGYCNAWLKRMNEGGKAGAINSISMVPSAGLTYSSGGNGKLNINIEDPNGNVGEKEYLINYSTLDDDYVPKNNKLFCWPYHFFSITTLDGQSYDYKYEDIIESDPTPGVTKMKFKFKFAFGADPTYFMYPSYYMKCNNNYDYGIKLSGFPKCNWNFGVWENYYAQQDTNITLSMIASMLGAGSAGAGTAVQGLTSKAGAGVSTAVGMLQAGIGAVQAGLSTFGGLSVVKSQPDQSKGANNVGGVNYNMETMDFWIIHKRLHWGYVVKIDDYFTKFGYRVNSTGVPNLHTRKYWNYLKLDQPSVTGNMPVGDMRMIKQILSNGITFWHTTDVGNYDLNNNEGVLGH